MHNNRYRSFWREEGEMERREKKREKNGKKKLNKEFLFKNG